MSAAANRLRRLIEVQAELSDPDLTANAVIDRVVRRAVELADAPGAEVQIIEGGPEALAVVEPSDAGPRPAHVRADLRRGTISGGEGGPP